MQQSGRDYTSHIKGKMIDARACYIGKYNSLPDTYKTIIHKQEGLYTNYIQTELEENNFKLPSFQDNNTKSDCGCGLDWSRIEAFQASNPGSNPGSRTTRELTIHGRPRVIYTHSQVSVII